MDVYAITRWLHVLVMGYWLGSDLVVNAVTHYFSRGQALPTVERDRLWHFLLDIDQHPRNALILSVPLGFTLAEDLDLVRPGAAGLAAVWAASAAWFAFMWLVHWRKDGPSGRALLAWDWRLRVAVATLFIALGTVSLVAGRPVAAPWLAAKLLLFGAVIGCGLAIRRCIADVAAAWPAFLRDGSTPAFETRLRINLRRATGVLCLLWGLLFVIGWLGAVKPA